MSTTLGEVNFFKLLESIYIIEATRNLEALVNRFQLIFEKLTQLIAARNHSLFKEIFQKAHDRYSLQYPERNITAVQLALIFSATQKQTEEYFFERYKSCTII